MSDHILTKYEERLRAMEAEIRRREISAQRDEAERAEKERREMEELILNRERALESATAQWSSVDRAPMPVDSVRSRIDEGEMRRLETLQKQIQDRENEMNRIRAMLALLSSATLSPVSQPEPQPQPQPQPPQSVQPQPQPVPQSPTQITITQNFSSTAMPAAPYPVQTESETKEKDREEPAPRETERIILTEAEAGGVQYSERLTFAESYVLLSPKQKKYCDGLRAYAMQKSGAKEFPAKYHLCVGNGQKVVIKFVIKNGTVIARFRLEDERLRRLRRSATSDDVEVKIKESEVPITDDTAYNVAKQMVDLRLTQIAEDIELQKQRAAERRKNKRND